MPGGTATELERLTPQLGISDAERIRRMNRQGARPLPWLHHLPEFKKPKGDTPIAILAGGPSLLTTLDDARKIPVSIACGSAHDKILELGFSPRYAVLCDADPIVCEWLKNPSPTVTYLVATTCHDAVFDRLKDYSVALWHAGDPDTEGHLKRGVIIGGGNTVTTRATGIAVNFGYRNQHYFGMDSCLIGGEKHAGYDGQMPEEPVTIRLGDPVTGREFKVLRYHLLQRQAFEDLCDAWQGQFEPTVHGDGLIAEWLRLSRLPPPPILS